MADRQQQYVPRTPSAPRASVPISSTMAPFMIVFAIVMVCSVIVLGALTVSQLFNIGSQMPVIPSVMDVNITNSTARLSVILENTDTINMQLSELLNVNVTNAEPIPVGLVQSEIGLNVSVVNQPLDVNIINTIPLEANVTVNVGVIALAADVNILNQPIQVTIPNQPLLVDLVQSEATVNVTITESVPLDVNILNQPIAVSIPNQPIMVDLVQSEATVNVTITDSVPLDVNILNQPIAVSIPDQPIMVDLVQSEANVNVILRGTAPDGNTAPLRITPTGTLYTQLRDPVSAYGTILSDSLYPIIQTNAVYGVNPSQVSPVVFGTGSVTASDSSFVVSSGVLAGSFAVLQSRKRLFYNAGQGSRAVFAARFPASGSNSTSQVAGLGTPENGVFFGYSAGVFGILYTNRGLRHIELLTVTTGSSTTQNVNVTLSGIAYSVPVTNSGNIQRTVYELASFTYNGWKVEPLGNTLRFVSHQSFNYVGSFTFQATTAVASFSLVRSGAAFTSQFTAQNAWNGDQMDGSFTPGSGIILDPSKYNVYMISLGYSGASAIRFYIQNGPDESRFILVHTLWLGNTLTATSFSNPNFPISIVSATAANGISATVNVGSIAGFIEGRMRHVGNRYSFSQTLSTTVDNTAYYPLFTIRNAYITNGVTNQGVLTVVGCSGAIKHSFPATLYLFRSSENGQHALGGNPNFSSYGTYTGILLDTSATSFTISSFTQLVWSGELAETGSINRFFLSDLEAITLEPGESLSLCARTASLTANYVTASLELREKQ